MMRGILSELLDTEGPVIGFLDKVGHLVVLGLMWFACCIPIVTIASSTTAFYYAVIKSVRRGQGNAYREFWRSFKDNLGRGIAVTVPALLLGGLLVFNLYTISASGENHSLVAGGCTVLLVLLCCVLVYICPVLSRFNMKTVQAWKLAFVMSFRFLHYTAAILAGTAVLVALQVYILPIPTVVFLPGAWCYVVTFMMENALRRYMPEKTENDDAWYYQ